MSNYAFPNKLPLPRSSFDLCDGPFSLGSTQVQQYLDRWAAWISSTGIRVGKWTPGMLLNDTNGAANFLFTAGERPSKVSISFEQDALYALAIQQDAATISVRRLVTNVVTEYTFTGNSPILAYNGIVLADTAATDLVCFYIKPAGDAIYARFQRDNFGTEYTIIASPVPIRELRKTDFQRVDGTAYQFIWAVSQTGKQMFFRSAAYPPFPQAARDKITFDSALDSGIVFANIVFEAASDKLTADNALDSGAITSTIVFSFAGDRLTYSATLDDAGDYTQVIFFQPATQDKITLDTAIDSGSYDLVVVSAGHPVDKITLDSSLSSGTYP